MKWIIILFLAVVLGVPLLAQDRAKFLYAEFADQSATLWPFYKPFGGNFDPALSLGYGFDLKAKEHSAKFLAFQLTGYKTALIGQGFNLTSSYGYRYTKSGLLAEASIGLGVVAYFDVRETFTHNDEGIYTSANPIHFAASFPVDILAGYDFGSVSLYIKFRYMVIGPYTEVMPVLPNSLLGLGIRYNINSSGE